MSQDALDGVKACVFDAYGTLFDFASAARACRDELGDRGDRLTALWRDKQLQYTWLRALQGRHADFWDVTGDALDFALETLEQRSTIATTSSCGARIMDTSAASWYGAEL